MLIRCNCPEWEARASKLPRRQEEPTWRIIGRRNRLESSNVSPMYVEPLSGTAQHICGSFLLTLNSQLLKKTLDNRRARWLMFRSFIASRAKAQFTYLLSERSFRGRLLTDHANKVLDLQVSFALYIVSGISLTALSQVEPDITKDSGTGRGARTLSGGEKSFSQVCLLLSLWEAMGSPIRCLDELYVTHPAGKEGTSC